MRIPLRIKVLKKTPREVHFEISTQYKSLYKLRQGIQVGPWKIFSCSEPEIIEHSKQLFIRGTRKSKDKKILRCPNRIWGSLERSINLLPAFVKGVSIEDEFFKRVSQ